jgi:hypothetical protein
MNSATLVVVSPATVEFPFNTSFPTFIMEDAVCDVEDKTVPFTV